MTFKNYSKYYDLLYKDKDYCNEANFVYELIRRYTPTAKNILDLGCGTGRHDFFLALKGYKIKGVDISEDMLNMANKSPFIYNSQFTKPHFIKHDIRTVRLDQKFDVVISLFHVISYQTTNEDVISTFKTAEAHLDCDGIFIFDCWYGPGVLTDTPTVRIKKAENEDMDITRIAEPTVHFHRNVVDVNYRIFVRDKISQKLDELRECHKMRYFFKPEIELFLRWTGLELIDFVEFMKETPPDKGKWNACFVCRKNKTLS